MKVVLIEDDQNKSKQIIQFFEEDLNSKEISLRMSYQSGLKDIIQNDYDLILLDMQLPNFDIKSGEDGYKFRKLAGVDILQELKRKRKNCRVIVVTQFETFGEGESYIELADLKKILKEQFPEIYLGTVFYSANKTLWKKELKELINKHIK